MNSKIGCKTSHLLSFERRHFDVSDLRIHLTLHKATQKVTGMVDEPKQRAQHVGLCNIFWDVCVLMLGNLGPDPLSRIRNRFFQILRPDW